MFLRDRLDTAFKLYQKGKVSRFLLSGDHGRPQYDEVNSMRRYLMKKGVPCSDIFLDHAGFNTYNSVVRAKEIFQVDTMLVASQKYHLSRCVFLGNSVGIHTSGVVSDQRRYGGIRGFMFREYFALIKSFYEAVVQPNPHFLGEEIPITGNSQQSHG